MKTLTVGVLQLHSSRQAEFMHNEVPGIVIPAALRERFAEASHVEIRDADARSFDYESLPGLKPEAGGRVEARSGGIGKGSEFEISLPISDDSLDETLAEILEAVPRREERRVVSREH